MRVSIPVDPYPQTASKTATLSYIQYCTTLPVAHVVAYNSSSSNPLGFESILVEKRPGCSLKKLWKGMSLEEKIDVAAQMSGFIT